MAKFIITSSFGETSLWRYSSALANELVSRSHQVKIILTGKRKDLQSINTNPSILTWPSTKPTRLVDFRYLHQLNRTFQPDCIIGFLAGINVSMLTGWWDKIPCRISYYQIISKAVERDSHLTPAQISFQRMRKRLVYLFATKVIAVSNASAQDAKKIYHLPPGKLSVLPILIQSPGVKPKRIYDKNKIVCVARLDSNKGQDVLIKAIPLLISKIPDLKVYFIGDGPSRQSCEEMTSNIGVTTHCIFTGGVKLHEVLHHMESAAALVLPTRDDALPLVTIEALSVGTPVIASRVGGIPEIIRDNETGILVQVEDSKDLAEKILEITTNQSLRESLSHNGRKFFESYYSLNNIHKHADYFEELLKSPQMQ